MINKEAAYDDLDLERRLTCFPKEIHRIMCDQLEGYGYSYAFYNGELVLVDDYYSNDSWISSITSTELLEKAIEFRTELFEEEYDDIDAADFEPDEDDKDVWQELKQMETYYKEMIS